MPKVSVAHSDARRTQILDAAARCFGRKGIHRTTMRDICQTARLSPGSVYTWFPSKKAIIAEMARLRAASYAAARQELGSNPRAAIRQYLDTVRQAAENPAVGWMNLHLAAEAVRDRFVRDVMREITHEGASVLEAAFIRLDPRRRADGAARARLLQAAAFGIVIQSLLSPGDAASFELAEELLGGPSPVKRSSRAGRAAPRRS